MKLVRKHCGDVVILYAALALGACSSSNGTPAPTPPNQPAADSGTTTPPSPAGGSTAATPPNGTINGTSAPLPPSTGDIPPTTPNGTGGTTAPPPATGGSTAPTTPPVTGTATVDWTTMGYDPGSTYFNAGETMLTKANAATLEVAWTADFGGNVYGAALQVGEKIYASGGTTVRGFEAATGKELWKASVPSSSALSYAEGTLFINATNGKLVALNAETGAEVWAKSNGPGADGTSSAVVAGDMVIVGASSGAVELTGGSFRGFALALNRKSGEQAWLTYTVPEGASGASFWSTLSADVAAGVVYGGTGNNYAPPATDTSDAIIAFDLKTGAIKWKNQRIKDDVYPRGGATGIDSDFGANPVLYETMVNGTLTKMVADGAKFGTIHGLQREDGKEVWTREICTGSAEGSNGIFTNFAWTGKHLLVACNAGTSATLFGIDAATGDVLWMRTVPGLVWGRTAVANGVGFAGVGKTLEVFDVDTGANIKTIPSKGGTVASTITVSRGRVAFGEGMSWLSGGVARGTTLTVLTVK